MDAQDPNTNHDVENGYLDDGHIHVCVRIRSVPSNPILQQATSSDANSNALPPHTPNGRKTTVLREAQKICVSTIENIVIMHDPKSLEDKSAIARDTNNAIQVLTDRANLQAAGRTRKSGKQPRTSSSRKTTGGSSTAAGGSRGLISTGTANYYECDQCLTSMDPAAMLKMPLIKSSDFLQPPPYGSQEDVYRATALHAVDAAVEGINSCVFAYGQTGSGKTYTLFGDTTNIRRDPGVVPRTLEDLFAKLESEKLSYAGNTEIDYSYSVSLSFFEIYQNEVHCLFSRQGPLHVQFQRDAAGKKETMIIHDLQQQAVSSAEKAYPLIETGLRRRQTGETGMNARSSRSHAILQARVSQWRTNRETRETVELNATINLVDLAGSERQKTANTDGKTREEGIQINQSLATLARVINDISRGAKFVNYRDSLLTMVLKDNLGGNSKTFMIATVSPIAFSFQESCATLSYAKDVRKIRNRPKVNKSFQTRANLLEQNMRLKSENEKLKEQMEEFMRRMQQQQQQGPNASALNLSGTVEVIGLSPVGARMVGTDSVFSTPAARAAAAAAGAYGALTADELRQLAKDLPGQEALLRATCDGLTSPLMATSHRRYANLAGIGGTCVEDGLVRVTSLMNGLTRFEISKIIGDTTTTTTTTATAGAPPAGEGEGKATTATATSEEEGAEGREESPELVIQRANSASVARAHGTPSPAPPGDRLGYLEVERVSQRACEQKYWVHFVAPAGEEAGSARLVDVQINGKSLGSARRELHHGDVVCVYLDDADAGSKEEGAAQHSLLSFHYVDLNCLSRTAGSLNSATLGQLAVSVDVPEDMEHLTLEGIQQLQRDNAKLLDMVRQQAQAMDYQSQVAGDSLSRLSPITPQNDRTSPNPRPTRSLSHTPVALTTQEAFRRTTVSPSIRARSHLPADLEEEELLRRAEQSVSQRLDSALRENEKLYKRDARRNAAYDELAAKLAMLEAGGSLERAAREESSDGSGSSSSSSEADSSAKEDGEDAPSVSVSPSNVRTSVMELTKSAMAARGPSSHIGLSMTRVSSSSEDDEDEPEAQQQQPQPQKKQPHQTVVPTIRAAEVEEVPRTRTARPLDTAAAAPNIILMETSEGVEKRFQAVLRERQQYNRNVELEALIDDLRAQIALLESRLRVSRDDTLDEQLLREAVEAERDALLRELEALRAENAELNQNTLTLETIVRQNEEALEAATTMNEEELDKRLAVMREQMKALRELAQLWKRRTMRYIAMGYGSVEDVNDPTSAQRLEEIPWDELRAGATAQIAKHRLGGKDFANHLSAEQINAVDAFEEATAQEALVAYESVLLDLEGENQRLQNAVDNYEKMLKELQDLVNRLRAERDVLEKEAANASANEEESQRLKKLLNAKMQQLKEAENNLQDTRKNLDSAIQQTKDNKRKAVKNNQLLLAEQRNMIENLERQVHQLQTNVTGKDEELRNLLGYMEGNEMLDKDGTLQDYQLRNRIEDLITEAMEKYGQPNGYSAFPADFEFSDEMIALIRICLRILLDRLKIELYVLNKQNLHKFGLLVPSIQLRPEAQFNTFVHELRGVVSEMAGRAQRIGGKWSVETQDVLSDLVDHRRRRAGNALSGLLIWYDHWDLSPKLEHVCYMELIRNGDRIMQMARLVRQESLLNTNATSTLMMPIPGKKGASDTSMLDMTQTARRKDSATVAESRHILDKLNANNRRSNLAQAVSPSKNKRLSTSDAAEAAANTPFSRSATATALALSQAAPFSRTATTVPKTTGGPGCPAPLCRSSTQHKLPGGRGSVGKTTTNFKAAAAAMPRLSTLSSFSAAPSQRPSVGSRRPSTHAVPGAKPAAGPLPRASSKLERKASNCIFPVSDNDITFVATSDVAQAESIQSYNLARRLSAAMPGETSPGVSPQKGAPADGEGGAATSSPSKAFSRCHTAMSSFSELLNSATKAARPKTAEDAPAAAAAAAHKPRVSSAAAVNSNLCPRPSAPIAPKKTEDEKAIVKRELFGRSKSTFAKIGTAASSAAASGATTPSNRNARHPTATAGGSPPPRTPAGVASKTKGVRRTLGLEALPQESDSACSSVRPSQRQGLAEKTHDEVNKLHSATGAAEKVQLQQQPHGAPALDASHKKAKKSKKGAGKGKSGTGKKTKKTTAAHKKKKAHDEEQQQQHLETGEDGSEDEDDDDDEEQEDSPLLSASATIKSSTGVPIVNSPVPRLDLRDLKN